MENVVRSLSLLTFIGKTRLRMHMKAKTSESNPVQRSQRALMDYGGTAMGSQHVIHTDEFAQVS